MTNPTGPDGFTLDGLIANMESGFVRLPFHLHEPILGALHELRERRAIEPTGELDLLRRIAEAARTVVLEDRGEFAPGELPDIDALEKLLEEWRPLNRSEKP